MSFLDRIKRGKIPGPFKGTVAGKEGIGKSTFGGTLPAPLFIDPERSTNRLAVDRLYPESYADLLVIIGELVQSESLPYQSIVVDTIDWIDHKLVVPETIRRYPTTSKGKPVKHLRDYGWGDGDKYHGSVWQELLSGFDALHAKGLHVLFLAHYIKRDAGETDVESYSYYDLALASKTASAMVVQWSECVFFARNPVVVVEQENGKSIVRSRGERLLYTEGGAGFVAKNRYGLPPSIPFDAQAWATIAHYMEKA